MGVLVRALGTGIGLAAEALNKNRSKPASGQSTPSNTDRTSSSQAYADPPPEYVEVADEATAEALIRSGQAERVEDYGNEKKTRGPTSPYDAASAPSNGQSKAAEAGFPEDDDDSSTDSDEDDGGDEAAWELDEMADRVAPPSYQEADPSLLLSTQDSQETKEKKEQQVVREIVSLAGPVPYPTRALPCPVILPQRRPRAKDRGFVRAYAPVLAECGISQEVFLKFLTDWHQASKADPWIDVIFVAAGVVGMVPEVAAQVVGTVVQVAAGTAREIQSRHRRNTFLDLVNQQLFMPRGLFAMVMSFKDEAPGQQQPGPLARLSGRLGKSIVTSERLDINQTAAKYSNRDPNLSKLKQGLQNIRLTSGKTQGRIELPEAAELVFPDLDQAMDKDINQDGKGKGPEKEGFKDKVKGAGEFVQDYLDRRAQAKYAAENHGSPLAIPDSSRTPFATRFGDPNHPVNSGSLISLLTGGALNPAAGRNERRAAKREAKQGRREYKQERKDMRREYKDERRVARGRQPRGPRKARRPRGKRQGVIRKLLQQDVLYLIVVNLPTEKEVQDSVVMLESAMAGQGSNVAY